MKAKDELNALDAADAHYRTEFRTAAREHLRDYVEAVTKHVPRFGHDAYVCPCCGSGSGNNGNFSPAFGLFRSQEGELRFKCHACDATGDIFDLARLTAKLPDFDAAERHVADFLGVDLARRTPLDAIRVNVVEAGEPPSQREALRLKKEASDYIISCRKNIGQTDFFHQRGFTDNTIRRFNLGYDPERKMAVIPFSSTYYASRSTQVEADRKGDRKHYKPAGLRQPLFNLGALSDTREPVFLTEAPLDAISIEQAGGRAIALGGTSTTVLSKVLGIYKPGNVFVLAFDADGPGERLRDRVSLMLSERGIPYSLPAHDAFFVYKDANATLMGDPALLEQGVAEEKRRARELYREWDDKVPVRSIDVGASADVPPAIEGAATRPFPHPATTLR